MPIEIRELIIRTHIVNEEAVSKKSDTTSKLCNEREFIERCVEQLVRRLNKKKER